MQLEMPAIDASAVDGHTAEYVKKAYEAVVNESPVGILPQNERSIGTVPVQIDPYNAPYAGVTEFKPDYTGRPRARRVGINTRARGKNAKRVAEHEFRHVRSEGLLNYMDVSEHQARLIMESYAEFAGIANGKEREIVHTTPYAGHVKFAYAVEGFYRSEFDGATGYKAFIRDIQKYQSARGALKQLGRSIKESGVSMKEVLRSAENRFARAKAA